VPIGTPFRRCHDFRHIDAGGLVFYLATTPGGRDMNITFEEVLYATLFEAMEQAWNCTESEYEALNKSLENE
jgi:hypothetical protein